MPQTPPRPSLTIHPSNIRRAAPGDADAIHRIITAYSDEGILLARTIDDIASSIDRFYVYDLDGIVAGAVTHCDYGDHLTEVRSLAVLKRQGRQGIGSALLRALIRDITAVNAPRIFVLTYAPGFFQKNGFTVIDINGLPEKIWKDCMNCKNWDTCSEVALEYAGGISPAR